jgi:pimeloyl-ACP methyl ester carboxylesterase
MRRLLVALLLPVLPIAHWQPAGAGDTPPPWRVDDLGAPFDGWDVEVSGTSDAQVVALAFDSPLLGLRAVSHVYLPAAYFDSEQPYPVAYFLHGTIRVHTTEQTEEVGRDLAEAGYNPGYPLGPGGDGRGPTQFVRPSIDEAEYLVVTPDSGPSPWCPYCFFLDSYDGQGVAAYSHLYDELLPLVEAVFRVRSDRGGRAILGRSMGAGAALIHGLRHPDRWAFVGAMSPSHLDWVDDPLLSPVFWSFYLRSQAFPPQDADEITWRNYNPLDLAPNAVGAPMEIVITMGDGCVGRTDGSCEDDGFFDNFPAAAGQEIPLRANADRWMPTLTQLGAPITYVQREGTHGPINQDSYERFMLPRMNRLFDEELGEPTRFSYKVADESFSIWGYDVAVDRPNTEFLSLLGARLDGTDVLLAGTGTVTLTTPASFQPGLPYDVEVTPIGSAVEGRTVFAGADGRLTLEVELGPTRQVDERRALVANGQGAFAFPQTRVEVLGPTNDGSEQ